MTALNQIKECLTQRHDFVLQGGAGSGKTETLKEVLAYISKTQPNATAACITLTNKAADEIKIRVGNSYHISTIHSFLHSLIDVFRSDVRSVLPSVFLLDPLVCPGVEEAAISYDIYKKRYRKFATLQYRFNKAKAEKVTGKKEFDKESSRHIAMLNDEIVKLNESICIAISGADLRKIKYNESSYDNVRHFSYGHDGLLKVAVALIEKYPKLQRVLGDRFDFIFVDEYQDTSPDVVRVLIEVLAKTTKSTIGLFGDSMQGIYKDGIGDVEKYIANEALRKIEKEDNFRCSKQVIDFLNNLRLDTLRQEVALKSKQDGGFEDLADRQGAVNLVYSVAPETAKEDKAVYLAKLKALIGKAKNDECAKCLMLTNKSIAGEVGFLKLYDVFTERYGQERGDEMERVLSALQFDEIARLCALHTAKDYNGLIAKVKNHGFLLNSKKDKERLYAEIDSIASSEISAIQTIEAAFKCGLLSRSDSFVSFVDYKDSFLAELTDDKPFQDFLVDVKAGVNTAVRMLAAGRVMDDYLFNELSNKLKRKNFFEALFGDEVKFDEVLSYFAYLNDEKPYVTMHKTKGTGILDVIVVLDEYFWRDYEFKNILSKEIDADQVMDRKLVYVACSRAIKTLTCVKIICSDEEAQLLENGFCSVQQFDYGAL